MHVILGERGNLKFTTEWPEASQPSFSSQILEPCLLCDCVYSDSPMSAQFLTWKGQASQGPLLIWATGPLLAALPRHCNFPGSWAVGTRQQHVQLAAGHAANLPISAGAAVLTVWFKLLSAAVNDSVEHTVVSL